MSPRIGADLNTIVQTAVEIADQDGLYEVTLTRVAQKLNIRPPSLYNHIDGLHELRRQMAIYGLHELYAALLEANANVKELDQGLHAIGEAYVDFARRHPGLYEATFQAPDPRDPEVERAGTEIVMFAVHFLSSYGLEGDEVIHATRGLRSILHGFASLEHKGGFRMHLERNESLHVIIDTFIAGIRKRERGE
ncbi:TetR-like C-terminal domain-containing protein [Paenibacillus guangzhouensis]|uniref:TetR-like C-terminal domain-containing protein n=1 Tax=Paenibacillus guangzhouensis TaxID=1473112 RepID=UPI001266AC14|nr:TetR-like C-terminal domain-containing protein [Paenibacillus guangzhouensis]